MSENNAQYVERYSVTEEEDVSDETQITGLKMYYELTTQQKHTGYYSNKTKNGQ